MPYLEEHARGFVVHGPVRWRTRDGVSWAVTDAATGELLGACGLVEIEQANRQSAAVAVAVGYERVGEPVTEEMKGTDRQFLTYERRADR